MPVRVISYEIKDIQTLKTVYGNTQGLRKCVEGKYLSMYYGDDTYMYSCLMHTSTRNTFVHKTNSLGLIGL